MKKLLAIFLSILLLCACVPLGAIPVSAATSGTTGDCIWQINGTELTISGMGAMADYDPYAHNNAPWRNENITSVRINSGVTHIGEYAFCSNWELLGHILSGMDFTSVMIPDTVTSIGEYAFAYCDSLSSVVIPDSVTAIGDYAFYSCKKLSEITLPDKVLSIGRSVFEETGHRSSHIGKHLVRAFDSAELWIPEGTLTVADFVYADVTSLTSVTIPASLERLGAGAFSGCINLTSITVNMFNPNYCVVDGILFSKDKTTLVQYPSGRGGVYTVPDYVTTIGDGAFRGSYLSGVNIPDSVTSIGEYAFYDCDFMTEITIPNSVTSIGEKAFYDCEYLSSVTLSNSITAIEELTFARCVSLGSITIPTGVATIGFQAFAGCTDLTAVTIPDSVTFIDTGAFYSCSALTEVYITDIAAWCNMTCSSSAHMRGNTTANPLYYAENLYLNGELLTDLVIPDGVTTLDAYAFYGCTSLTSVTIPDSVTSIGHGAFYGCTSLVTLSIGDGVTTLRNSTFYGCTVLTSVYLSDSITASYLAFSGCTGIKDVYYKGLESQAKNIDAASERELWNATWHFHWNNHTYDADCDDKCDGCGEMRTPGAHVYDNACDADCNGCGLIRNVSDHVYVGEMTSAATCTADGAWTYTCTECGDSYVEYVSALGHVSVTLSGYAATCVTDGLTDGAACSVCGEILTAQVIIPAMGRHLYDNACDTDCNVCGEVRQVSGHAYTGRVTTEVTCTQNGVKTYACANCGDNYTEDIPALGHIYDNEYDATCNHCGEVRGVEVPADAPAFAVDMVTATAGETVTVAIRTRHNPGIVSLKLRVAYDAAVLELVSIEGADFADAFFSPLTNNPFIVTWTDAIHPDNTTDGVVALITFRVKEDAAAGTTAVTVTYDPEDVYDQNFDNVAFYVENGGVEIVEYTPGDVNEDGKINNKDLGLLQQHLAEWDVALNLSAADTNADGRINNKDLGLLQQYLAEWGVTLG